MRSAKFLVVAVLAVVLVGVQAARATLITTFYGDDDGFGIGETTAFASDPTTSNAGIGEAAFTDVRLIGDTCCLAPAFAPTGSFAPFTIPGGETIVSALLTLRTGAFDSGPNPVDLPQANEIWLDGLLVPSSFINGFSSANSLIVETLSIGLGPTFLAVLGDGSVSLNGTHISEDGGSGSFQVDFLRLDIETVAVPEPSTIMLLGTGLLFLGVKVRKRSKK